MVTNTRGKKSGDSEGQEEEIEKVLNFASEASMRDTKNSIIKYSSRAPTPKRALYTYCDVRRQ